MRQFSIRYIPPLVALRMVLFSAELRGDEPVVQVDIDAGFPTHAPRDIKFLEFGWDIRSASFVAAYIDEMAKRPLDGVVFKPVDGGYYHATPETLNAFRKAAADGTRAAGPRQASALQTEAS